MVYSLPCHPRNFRTVRAFGSSTQYTVPQGKIFVLTALGVQVSSGTAPSGLIAPLPTLYVNGAIALRGGMTGYISNPAYALREFQGPTTNWTKVPDGMAFQAGTVLSVAVNITALPNQWYRGRFAGYLVSV